MEAVTAPTRSWGIPPRAMAFWPAVALIAVADFFTKHLAEANLTLHLPKNVLGEWFRFTLTYNTGAAMNLSLGSSSRVILVIVAAVMLVVVFRMYRGTSLADSAQATALGLIAGGALGNLIDRLRSARGVVDFVDVGAGDWRFWTFNIADSGVTCGAILLALILMRRPAPTDP